MRYRYSPFTPKNSQKSRIGVLVLWHSGFPQHRPIDAWAQLLAGDGVAAFTGRALDRRAMFRRHTPALFLPLADGALRHAEQARKRSCGADDTRGFVERVFSLGIFHGA